MATLFFFLFPSLPRPSNSSWRRCRRRGAVSFPPFGCSTGKRTRRLLPLPFFFLFRSLRGDRPPLLPAGVFPFGGTGCGIRPAGRAFLPGRDLFPLFRSRFSSDSPLDTRSPPLLPAYDADEECDCPPCREKERGNPLFPGRRSRQPLWKGGGALLRRAPFGNALKLLSFFFKISTAR